MNTGNEDYKLINDDDIEKNAAPQKPRTYHQDGFFTPPSQSSQGNFRSIEANMCMLECLKAVIICNKWIGMGTFGITLTSGSTILAGVIGSAILASSGYEDFDLAQTAKAAALGGLIAFPAFVVAKAVLDLLIHYCKQNRREYEPTQPPLEIYKLAFQTLLLYVLIITTIEALGAWALGYENKDVQNCAAAAALGATLFGGLTSTCYVSCLSQTTSDRIGERWQSP